MSKKIIIPIIVILVVSLGVFAWFYLGGDSLLDGGNKEEEQKTETNKSTTSSEQIKLKTESPLPAGASGPSVPDKLEFQK